MQPGCGWRLEIGGGVGGAVRLSQAAERAGSDAACHWRSGKLSGGTLPPAPGEGDNNRVEDSGEAEGLQKPVEILIIFSEWL